MRWRELWEDSGAVTVDANGGVRQLLIESDSVNMRVGCTAPLNPNGRFSPRDDWAPPATLPHRTIQIFVACTPDKTAWGYTIIRGGNAADDVAATLVASAAGPGATASQLAALAHALEYVDESPPPIRDAPRVIRLGGREAYAAAGAECF